MKALIPILSAGLLIPAYGQTAYTAPSGYVKVDVPAAPSAGQRSLTSVSAGLLNEVEFSGAVTINSDYSSGTSSQTLSVSGVTWSATQWTAESHIAFITDIAGGEQSFRISTNTTDGGITVETPEDLLPTTNARFNSSTTITIRKAHTIGSLFSNGSSTLASGDSVFVRQGGVWTQFSYNGSIWTSAGDPFTDRSSTIVFPDEGVFIARSALSGVTLTWFGDVPTKPQVTTLDGAASDYFVGSRYPVGTTIDDLNIEDSAGWNNSTDSIYLWNGSSWDQFSYDGTAWRAAGNPFSDAGTTAIPSNSAIFVVTSASSAASISTNIPYTVE